ncbi:MAG: hypothetical protein QXS20_10300 [Candidatus Thorarchaeota archaeon]
MNFPFLTPFLEGIRLMWQDKKLRWLFIVFLLSSLFITVIGSIAARLLAPLSQGLLLSVYVVTAGTWPVFFMLCTILSIAHLQRLFVSDESYGRSFGLMVPWLVVSAVLNVVLITVSQMTYFVLMFGVAFLGWISFQAFFATSASIHYADTVQAHVSRVSSILSLFSNLACYAIVVGSLIFGFAINLFNLELARVALILMGTGLALLFNFVNGVLIVRHRHRSTLGNIVLLGLFVAVYSAYFIYSAATATVLGIDPIAWSLSLFFVLYTVSRVSRTLSSRANIDTRWKMSVDTAVPLTFFLASGYYFTDMLLPLLTVVEPDFGASLSDIVRLLTFTLVALIMQLVYLRKLGRTSQRSEAEPTRTPPTVPAPAPTSVETAEDVPGSDHAGQEVGEESGAEDEQV